MKFSDITLTVVMPSYNRGEYIEAAINSVMKQEISFKIKLIIADDASTDKSCEICNEYQKKYPGKVEIMTSKVNQGLFKNYLRVWPRLKSDYFCILDPDDFWIDDFWLERAVMFLEENKDFSIYGENVVYMREGCITKERYIKVEEKEYITEGIESYLSGKAKVTNTISSVFRNCICKEGWGTEFLEKYKETDGEASFRADTGRYLMHLKYGKAKFVDRVMGVYRIHEKGLWSSSSLIHRRILSARAKIDYSDYYDNQYQREFYEMAYRDLQGATEILYKSFCLGRGSKLDDIDGRNYFYVYNRLAESLMRKGNEDFTPNLEQWIDFMRNADSRKVIIWGNGNAARRLIEKYKIRNVDYFVSNTATDCEGVFWGKPIKLPVSLMEAEYPRYVVICSSYWKEIEEQINCEGLCSCKEVINLYMYDKYMRNFH